MPPKAHAHPPATVPAEPVVLSDNDRAKEVKKYYEQVVGPLLENTLRDMWSSKPNDPLLWLCDRFVSVRMDAERIRLAKLQEANKVKVFSYQPTLPVDALADPARPADEKETRLFYFDLNWHADPIRLALHYASVEFEDCRIVCENIEVYAERWLSFFGKCGVSAAQPPMLELDGKRYGGKHAILELVCAKHGFTAEKATERYNAQWLCEMAEQLWRLWEGYNWPTLTDLSARTAAASSFCTKDAPTILVEMNNMVLRTKPEGGKFLVESLRPTKADFTVCTTVHNLFLSEEPPVYSHDGVTVSHSNDTHRASTGFAECARTHAPDLVKWATAVAAADFGLYFTSEQRRPKRGL